MPLQTEKAALFFEAHRNFGTGNTVIRLGLDSYPAFSWCVLSLISGSLSPGAVSSLLSVGKRKRIILYDNVDSNLALLLTNCYTHQTVILSNLGKIA